MGEVINLFADMRDGSYRTIDKTGGSGTVYDIVRATKVLEFGQTGEWVILIDGKGVNIHGEVCTFRSVNDAMVSVLDMIDFVA